MKQFLENYLEAWNSRQLDKLLEHFDEEVSYRDIALGEDYGYSSLPKFIEETYEAFPLLKFEYVSHCENENWLAWEWRMSGCRKSGEDFDYPGMSMTAIREGKIVSNRDYWSTLPPGRS
jgi:ketosteroid isomerase-like protein